MSKEVISHILHCHSTVYQMRSPISAHGVWGPAVPAGSWQWCSPWQASTMALYWARNINTTMRGLNCTNNIHGVGQTDWKRSKKRKPKQEFWNKTDHGLCGHGSRGIVLRLSYHFFGFVNLVLWIRSSNFTASTLRVAYVRHSKGFCGRTWKQMYFTISLDAPQVTATISLDLAISPSCRLLSPKLQ